MNTEQLREIVSDADTFINSAEHFTSDCAAYVEALQQMSRDVSGAETAIDDAFLTSAGLQLVAAAPNPRILELRSLLALRRAELSELQARCADLAHIMRQGETH